MEELHSLYCECGCGPDNWDIPPQWNRQEMIREWYGLTSEIRCGVRQENSKHRCDKKPDHSGKHLCFDGTSLIAF